MDIYEKSQEIIKEIIKAQKKFDFEIILVGGWAVYCYNPYMKSKDIDFLIKDKDLWKLSNSLDSLGFRQTGEVLEKKGFAMIVGEDKIELDVYNKTIGNILVNEIFEKKLFIKKRFFGFDVNVVNPNILFALKIISASERIGTGKGMKDVSDILALLDKFKIDLSLVYSYVSRETVKHVLSIIFSDYKKIKNVYPIGFLKFQKIKQQLIK